MTSTTQNARFPLRRCMVRACAVALLLVPVGCAGGASGGASSSAAGATEVAASTGVVQSSFFGMVVRNPVNQPSVAAGARRVCDPTVNWAAIEPAPGSFNWSALDAAVASAQEAGSEVTLTLGMTPSWASSSPGLASSWGNGATAMPQNLADWDAYVSAVATRYAGRIAHYEVWNNPSGAANWSGAADTVGSDMALLSTHAAADVAAADPAANVVAPALDADALGSFVAANGAQSVAAIAVALSPSANGPEGVVSQLAGLRAALATNTQAEVLPLWNDQPSWELADPSETVEDQAAETARAVILNASYGVQRMFWYAWDETGAGTLQLSGTSGQPTMAAAAYTAAENWLTGAQVNGCSESPSGLWSCQLVRGGAPEWILWSTSGTVQASALGMTTATSLVGQTENVVGGKVTVDASPELLQ